jgi:alpha-beta hydrolase superfamily lysophospholipase
MGVEVQQKWLKTPDGIKISTWIAKPNNPMAIILICHGITVDSTEGGFFLTFEKELVKNNIGVVRFDFRCHGKSEGLPKDLTLHGEYLDVDTVYSEIIENFNIPKFIEATSFSGSAVIKKFSEIEKECNGLILWNPILNYKETFLIPSTPWVASILETRNNISLPNWAYARIPGSNYYLTNKMVKEFMEDITLDLLINIRRPIVGFHGDSDTKIPYKYIVEASKNNPNIQINILKGEAHGFKGKRPFVMKKTIEWLIENIEDG